MPGEGIHANLHQVQVRRARAADDLEQQADRPNRAKSMPREDTERTRSCVPDSYCGRRTKVVLLYPKEKHLVDCVCEGKEP